MPGGVFFCAAYLSSTVTGNEASKRLLLGAVTADPAIWTIFTSVTV
jgi:hypothetical protein